MTAPYLDPQNCPQNQKDPFVYKKSIQFLARGWVDKQHDFVYNQDNDIKDKGAIYNELH